MSATDESPHGVLNVGIFGEGVDTPALSAVGFLEARKSPVDVIQAVGRVMRRAEGKEMGYIICPILIPPHTDAETWLRHSSPEDGWRELGQILLALRAHDGRIEDNLSELMQLYLPYAPAEEIATMVTIGGENKRVQHYGHIGKPRMVERDVENIVSGKAKPNDLLCPISFVIPTRDPSSNMLSPPSSGLTAEQIVSGKQRHDGSIELRRAGIERVKSKGKTDGTPSPVDAEKSKRKGRKMVNEIAGRKIEGLRRENRSTKTEQQFMRFLDEADSIEICVNLLERSGLARNRVERDVNILEDSIQEAKRCLKNDELDAVLDEYFGLNHLAEDKRKKQADGCTIASLLLMNAAMLHQRIAAGGWLSGISGLETIKNAPEAIDELHSQWNRITRHDFLPVIEPAIDIIETVRKSGKRTGLNRALRHLSGEAERIAESYADLGADYAGPLFNKVMGNQASDGAYFTRPSAAALLAMLTLDVTDSDVDWTAEATWKNYRTVDLACGSGTLVAAVLTDMKRRARNQGANSSRLAQLHKLAVEQLVAGLDFNPVSLQLAAAQLTADNSNIVYRKIQLHKMPYGPTDIGEGRVGTLELLNQSRIVPRHGQFDLGDATLSSARLRMTEDDPLLEDAVDSVKDVRIMIMNPPFTNRSKMGEKFPVHVQKAIRSRTNSLEALLTRNDPAMVGFVDKNSIAPLFVALAERCVDSQEGVLAMIHPTIALTAPSARQARINLAKRFHIHTLVTCHQPNQINLSQNTNINESMIIASRHEGQRPWTRIINLDRLPLDGSEVVQLHKSLLNCPIGLLADGWGEVSLWPVDRIEAGDWTAAIWRSSHLAEAAAKFSEDQNLTCFGDRQLKPVKTGATLSDKFKLSCSKTLDSFPILKSKGADGQTTIRGMPDEYWTPKNTRLSDNPSGIDSLVLANRKTIDERQCPETKKILEKAGYLLVTFGQDSSTARLTAVASEVKYIGVGWMPVPNLTVEQAKAAAVFLNSTVGRLQIMRNLGQKLAFPTYNPASWSAVKTPDFSEVRTCKILADCWHITADIVVPQYRDGECEVRRLWDDAVADALDWDSNELAKLRMLLHEEPHVRGLGRDQYA